MTEETRTKLRLISSLPLFAGCEEPDLKRLAEVAHPVAFNEGERLCVAGSDSPECYVVAEGEAHVTVGNVTVDVIRPLDVVGERGPITGRPRAATVTAKSNMTTYAISREEIRALIGRSPSAASTMRDELLRRYG
jgi:putative ABC transport system ATP-binding protein